MAFSFLFHSRGDASLSDPKRRQERSNGFVFYVEGADLPVIDSSPESTHSCYHCLHDLDNILFSTMEYRKSQCTGVCVCIGSRGVVAACS